MFNNGKKWYTSRTVWLGVLGCVIYGLKLAGVEVPAPEGDVAAVIGAAVSIIVIILRWRTTQPLLK